MNLTAWVPVCNAVTNLALTVAIVVLIVWMIRDMRDTR